MKSGKKPGGQPGHNGTTLEKVDDPDEICDLKLDRRTLPKGAQYKSVGFEGRQVFDIKISRHVIEYRAEILEDEHGKRFTAPFPDDVSRPVQYGNGIKAHAVYMSQQQLIPYDRVRDHFHEQIHIPVSAGSIFNFNTEAFERLEFFEQWIKNELANVRLLHVDETGINIDGKKHWIHSASNDSLTFFYPHTKRGKIAMDEIGILPRFNGILSHDHWKAYYQYNCRHSLCNAHHIRELERAWEQDKQRWAKKMKIFLFKLNKRVKAAGGKLPPQESAQWRLEYRKILDHANAECPPPEANKRTGKRGRLKRTKPRNLLERLRDYEKDVLLFMDEKIATFTNNTSENDLRMTKVQQKISGCFRAEEGAKIFCRVRSYLITCRKQGLTATEALTMPFEGKNPEFMNKEDCNFC
jgi:transposase